MGINCRFRFSIRNENDMTHANVQLPSADKQRTLHTPWVSQELTGRCSLVLVRLLCSWKVCHGSSRRGCIIRAWEFPTSYSEKAPAGYHGRKLFGLLFSVGKLCESRCRTQRTSTAMIRTLSISCSEAAADWDRMRVGVQSSPRTKGNDSWFVRV